MVDAAPVMPTQALRRRELVPVALPRAASDQRLVEQVRAGSDRAFEALFDRHHRSVLAFCRHMLDSREEAEDAVQLTFMAAYRDLVDAAQPRALRPWLFGIARHRCISALRLRRQRSAQTIAEPLGDHVGSEVLAREDLRAILADMAGLPDDQRAALVLAELGGLPHEEIAQVLGCRRQKVKALVFQARASLAASRTARETPCAEIREQLATLRGGALRRSALRRHLRDCAACQAFHDEVSSQRRLPRVLLPVAPTLGVKRAVLGALCGGGGAGGTALTVGALGTTGLAAVALATAAIHAGGVRDVTTPSRDARAPAIEQTGWVAALAAGAPAALTAAPAPARSHHRVSRGAGSVTVPVAELPRPPARPVEAGPNGAAPDAASAASPSGQADDDRAPSGAQLDVGEPTGDPAPVSAPTVAQSPRPAAPSAPRPAPPDARANPTAPVAPATPTAASAQVTPPAATSHDAPPAENGRPAPPAVQGRPDSPEPEARATVAKREAAPPQANAPQSPSKSDAPSRPEANAPSRPEPNTPQSRPEANAPPSPSKPDTRPQREANAPPSPSKPDTRPRPEANTPPSPSKPDTRPQREANAPPSRPEANAPPSPSKPDTRPRPEANAPPSPSKPTKPDAPSTQPAAPKPEPQRTPSAPSGQSAPSGSSGQPPAAPPHPGH
jgi:RNA polymerase sigma factor (sigma-70 family)